MDLMCRWTTFNHDSIDSSTSRVILSAPHPHGSFSFDASTATMMFN